MHSLLLASKFRSVVIGIRMTRSCAGSGIIINLRFDPWVKVIGIEALCASCDSTKQRTWSFSNKDSDFAVDFSVEFLLPSAKFEMGALMGEISPCLVDETGSIDLQTRIVFLRSSLPLFPGHHFCCASWQQCHRKTLVTGTAPFLGGLINGKTCILGDAAHPGPMLAGLWTVLMEYRASSISGSVSSNRGCGWSSRHSINSLRFLRTVTCLLSYLKNYSVLVHLVLFPLVLEHRRTPSQSGGAIEQNGKPLQRLATDI